MVEDDGETSADTLYTSTGAGIEARDARLNEGQAIGTRAQADFFSLTFSTCSVWPRLPFSRAVSERRSSGRVSEGQPHRDAQLLSRSSASDCANFDFARIFGPCQYILSRSAER